MGAFFHRFVHRSAFWVDAFVISVLAMVAIESNAFVFCDFSTMAPRPLTAVDNTITMDRSREQHYRGRTFRHSREARRAGTCRSSTAAAGAAGALARLSMCICVDCARVTNCAAYHFVEAKHEQPHMTEDPTFEPRDGSPTIHVNIRSLRNQADREAEVQRMWREHASETARAEEQQRQQATATSLSNSNSETATPSDSAFGTTSEEAATSTSSALHGETVYDMTPVTVYEYDVVACEDFVQDKGCWVRNMPEEIRKANPHFVPS